jgi:hypothetical protein
MTRSARRVSAQLQLRQHCVVRVRDLIAVMQRCVSKSLAVLRRMQLRDGCEEWDQHYTNLGCCSQVFDRARRYQKSARCLTQYLGQSAKIDNVQVRDWQMSSSADFRSGFEVPGQRQPPG